MPSRDARCAPREPGRLAFSTGSGGSPVSSLRAARGDDRLGIFDMTRTGAIGAAMMLGMGLHAAAQSDPGRAPRPARNRGRSKPTARGPNIRFCSTAIRHR